tara:strand:+ start:412 stop:558 length:147 start_codon:yes stop_codon:yes gene_type:complete
MQIGSIVKFRSKKAVIIELKNETAAIVFLARGMYMPEYVNIQDLELAE